MIRKLLGEALVILAIDQLLKKMAVSSTFLALPAPICNHFIAWGIPLKGLWLTLFWLIAFSGLLVIIKKYPNNFSLGLVLGGACSNLIDRFFYGCVIDYLNLPLLSAFPAFNLADVAISLGFGIFLFKNFLKLNVKSE